MVERVQVINCEGSNNWETVCLVEANLRKFDHLKLEHIGFEKYEAVRKQFPEHGYHMDKDKALVDVWRYDSNA